MNNWKILSLATTTIALTLLAGASFTYKTPEIRINYTSDATKNTTEESLLKEPVENLPMPESIHHQVHFTAQAPFGNWKDNRQETACEEASVIMVLHWAENKTLTPEEALKEITTISDYELETYGYFEDTSAKDTLDRIIKSYFKYTSANLIYDISIDDIRKELAKNRLVIVPVNARILANPYYTPPGPTHHMMVIIGYDDITQKFIAHDPGTRYGKNFRYSYETITSALEDYESGRNKPTPEKRTAMIVIAK